MLCRSGVFVIHQSDSGGYSDQSYTNDISLGARIEDLHTPEAIRAIFPSNVQTVSFEGVSGYLNRDGGWAFATQGIALLMRRVASHGAQILSGKAVTSLIQEGGRTTGVRCADGTHYDADLVVIASGSWTPSTFPALDLKGKCLATGYVFATLFLL